jgi:hypothetical protein
MLYACALQFLWSKILNVSVRTSNPEKLLYCIWLAAETFELPCTLDIFISEHKLAKELIH